MSITLPPLPQFHTHGSVALNPEGIRSRDLEVAKCVLEAVAKVCEATYTEAHHTGCGYVIERFPQFAGGKDCAQAIRALGVSHD